MAWFSRPGRPCDACRKRKIRCLVSDSARDCVLCRSHGQQCTFLEAPPKKKRKQTDVVSPEEAAVASISPAETQQEQPHDYSNCPEASLLSQTLGHQHFRTNSYIGATSSPSRLLLELPSTSQPGRYRASVSGSEVRRVGQDGYFLMLPDDQDAIKEQLEVLDKIEAAISPYGPALVELYFRIVHPSFPILHKDVFLVKYGRSYRELTPACLAAVYMLALNWWSYSVDLADSVKPDISDLEQLVPGLIAFDKAAKVSDIQAGLLFLQRPRHDSWRLTAQLVATAEEVGLHRDCTDWEIPGWEKGVRKRLAWALFMQDKWGALVHGRPSHIKADNWEVFPLEHDDFPENVEEDHVEQGSSEVEKGILIFIHLSTLTQILSNVIDELFTVEASKRHGSTVALLQTVKPIQLRLKSWYNNLPSCLELDTTTSRKLSATGQLYLAYLTVEVTLHRAIVESEMKKPLDAGLRQITREAAIMRFKSVVDFLKRLKPEHMQGFWHFASGSCLAIIGTFSLVLLATSTDPNESRAIYSQIAEFRWLLKINGPGAGFTKPAVDLLQSNAGFLARYRPQGPTKVIPGNIQGRANRPAGQTQSKTLSNTGSQDEVDGNIANTQAFENISEDLHASPSGIGFSPGQAWLYDFDDLVSQVCST
ncbi:uncharacterized protein PV07_02955 [Cladophialophora immunda]|uniref:Zn(2)-C6 fungal-type domain-containing protein n=1 Tax=Cladophialophora immunda TaxID=569365 RepID=A0A0D2CMK2_9EURO|nr:uncharacterized protein PV07_02955 [Cladophialophora immunda]KIW31295.1 hypothetical protein PV07_02955 [Cladophialophora immunda]OQV09120.1 Fungal Zn2-Cys6 binuclear cluster domain-containing protein [Cladophialophora immunda]